MQKIQHLLSDHLNIWTTVEAEKKSGRGRTNISGIKIYGIQKLRELILDLAISGKLTAKKTIDNLAINVSKDIKIEINKLTEKGLLAKRKLLAPIKENEKLFNLPNGWEWIRLGNTGKIFNGNSINENEKETRYTNINDGRPFIATKDVGYGREELNYKNGILIPFNESKFKVAHKNAVLICSEGGSAGKKIGITKFDICFGNKLLANETFSAINPRLIFYIYQSQSFYQSFFKRMTGIIGGISINEFLNIPIPIPPLKQQNEIVSKIDDLMALCDQLEQQHINSEEAHNKLVKVLLDTLTQSRDAEEFKDCWQRIANHFDTLFFTEDSIDDLKQRLFQIAVMGKLVPQDSNDEPASELVKRIQASKTKLIAEGKLKQEKVIPQIAEDEKPFKLPEGWEWTTLKTVAVINPRNNAADETLASFVPMTLIGNEFNEKHQDEKRIWKDIKQGFTHFAENDIGVAKITPCFENSKACVFENLENGLGAGTTELHVVRPIINTLNPRYILAYLKTPRFLELGESKMTGTAGQKRLPKDFVEMNPFPLPPLHEQHRIVTKLNELMLLCDQLKILIQQASAKQKQIADVLVSQALH